MLRIWLPPNPSSLAMGMNYNLPILKMGCTCLLDTSYTLSSMLDLHSFQEDTARELRYSEDRYAQGYSFYMSLASDPARCQGHKLRNLFLPH
mmetsp:Transcript_85301/g.156430  ORF Transcript_85301/g.156430 Transcript_85301/m.156430 type:complete len:92 (-) Transcript_85301:186-461(-)